MCSKKQVTFLLAFLVLDNVWQTLAYRYSNELLEQIAQSLENKYGDTLPSNISSLLTVPKKQPAVLYIYPPNCECKAVHPDQKDFGVIPSTSAPKKTLAPLPGGGRSIPASRDPVSLEWFACLTSNMGSFPEAGTTYVDDGVLIYDQDTLTYFWETKDGQKIPVNKTTGKVNTLPTQENPVSLRKLQAGYFEFDAEGNKYFVDYTGQVYWVGPDGYILVVPFIHIPGKFYVYGESNARYFTSSETGQVYEIDQKGIPVGAPKNSKLSKGHFSVDQNGRNWFTDNENGQKYFIDQNGNIESIGYDEEATGKRCVLFHGKLWVDQNRNRIWLDYETKTFYYIDPQTNRIWQGSGRLRVERGTFITDERGQHWFMCDLTKVKYLIDQSGNIVGTFRGVPKRPKQRVLIYVDEKRRLCVMQENKTVNILPREGGAPIVNDTLASVLVPDGFAVIGSNLKMYWVSEGSLFRPRQAYMVDTNGKMPLTDEDLKDPWLRFVDRGVFVVDGLGYLYWYSENGYFFLLNRMGFITKQIALLPGRLVIYPDGTWFWADQHGDRFAIVDGLVVGLPEMKDCRFGYHPNFGYYMAKNGFMYHIIKSGFIILKTIKDISELESLPSTSTTPAPTRATLRPDQVCPGDTVLNLDTGKCELGEPELICHPGFELIKTPKDEFICISVNTATTTSRYIRPRVMLMREEDETGKVLPRIGGDSDNTEDVNDKTNDLPPLIEPIDTGSSTASSASSNFVLDDEVDASKTLDHTHPDDNLTDEEVENIGKDNGSVDDVEENNLTDSEAVEEVENSTSNTNELSYGPIPDIPRTADLIGNRELPQAVQEPHTRKRSADFKEKREASILFSDKSNSTKRPHARKRSADLINKREAPMPFSDKTNSTKRRLPDRSVDFRDKREDPQPFEVKNNSTKKAQTSKRSADLIDKREAPMPFADKSNSTKRPYLNKRLGDLIDKREAISPFSANNNVSKRALVDKRSTNLRDKREFAQPFENNSNNTKKQLANRSSEWRIKVNQEQVLVPREEPGSEVDVELCDDKIIKREAGSINAEAEGSALSSEGNVGEKQGIEERQMNMFEVYNEAYGKGGPKRTQRCN